jgi:RNA polymerase sigma-70 factor (ECF subfamily)
MQDLDLIAAARAGDSLALSRLLDVLAPQVARICGPIALDHAADAAQETLIQVFRDLHTLREPAALVGWVRRIATREAIRHARRARRESALEPALAASLPAPGDPALAADVRSVLESLRPEQRAILVLRDLEGLSEEEAAGQLALARGTAKSRLHRARLAFAERWMEAWRERWSQ